MENGNGEKDRQAEALARKHYEVDHGVTTIIRFTQHADVEIQREEPIKLLEVNQNTVPSGIMPLQFAPSAANGTTYPATIIEVTPEEYEQIKRHQLELPPGWLNPIPIEPPAVK